MICSYGNAITNEQYRGVVCLHLEPSYCQLLESQCFMSLSPRKKIIFRDLHAQMSSCLWGGALWRCLSLLKDHGDSGENWFILDALRTRRSQATWISFWHSFDHLVHTSSILHSLDNCNEECCEWGTIVSAANDAVLLPGNTFPQFTWIIMNFFL